MTDMTTAQLVATVASAAVRATLAAAGGTRPTPIAAAPRPGQKPLSTPKPSTPPRREPMTVDRQALAVAVHEAGHSVAAVALGAELRNTVVGELRDGLKGKTYYFADTMPQGRAPEFAYAGPWAEARWLAGRRPSQRQLFAAFDGHGCRDQRVLTAAGGLHTGADVQPILERCWPAVLTVARQLHLTGEAHHDDVCAALGVTDGGGMTSVQLASLRSGGHQVPPFTKTPAPAA
ncbi:hypothetical protein [Mycolicibacterium sp. HK-90]|uniref:hypothetical protein n=1 Tax=Mycolicibacterium sp. HK-90 TaxID=3056937 RepID=UPI00265ACD97|nr:hypothetical protein [Mycolicibacterium sp. HK-90]WKG01383.1 hypothetical protein QU592_19130 [Mycolicibacterium sp. HK-90]